MKRKLVGIHPYDVEMKNSVWCAVKEQYYKSVWRYGGCPVSLCHTTKPEEISDLVKHLDSFLMVGGPDVPAHIYNSQKPELLDEDVMSNDREAFDRAVFKEAMIQEKKVLSICAGLQQVNVIYGGTLIEDIPALVEGAIDHGDFNGEPSSHKVRIIKETNLFEIVGKDEMLVKSSHHQSVKKLGNNLMASAFATDGIIEAIEIPGNKNFIGVQWHPEVSIENEETKALFEWLIK